MSSSQIQPEYSAQARHAPPNPFVNVAITALRDLFGGRLSGLRVADQGCGQLRHYHLLAPLARELVLVDMREQLTKYHLDGGQVFTVEGVAARARRAGRRVVRVLAVEEFERTRLGLDLIFSVAVLDVVPLEARRRIIAAAARNVRRGGYYIVIVPRNDASILRRCGAHNQYLDGHVFSRPGMTTFYRNFDDAREIKRLCSQSGLNVVRDVSRYRQVCLITGREYGRLSPV